MPKPRSSRSFSPSTLEEMKDSDQKGRLLLQ